MGADPAAAPELATRLPRVDDRRVLDGILRVLRTGSPWHDLPERYGPSRTVYNPLKPLRPASGHKAAVPRLLAAGPAVR